MVCLAHHFIYLITIQAVFDDFFSFFSFWCQQYQFSCTILPNRCHPYLFHSATTTANVFLGLYRWSPRHNDHFQLGTACHFPMLDLFTASRNRLELSPLDCRKLCITTIYDRDFHSSFQKNESTVHPTIGIDVFH